MLDRCKTVLRIEDDYAIEVSLSQDEVVITRVKYMNLTKYVFYCCRDLVRKVRQCKTAAEERDVIAKESAALRQAFKEQDSTYRHRYVSCRQWIEHITHGIKLVIDHTDY